MQYMQGKKRSYHEVRHQPVEAAVGIHGHPRKDEKRIINQVKQIRAISITSSFQTIHKSNCL